jgi:hypothetical protein
MSELDEKISQAAKVKEQAAMIFEFHKARNVPTDPELRERAAVQYALAERRLIEATRELNALINTP